MLQGATSQRILSLTDQGECSNQGFDSARKSLCGSKRPRAMFDTQAIDVTAGAISPGPTSFNDLSGALCSIRSRMFVFSSRISLVNRWSIWEAPRSPDRWCRLGTRAAELARLGRRRWLRTPQGAIRAALIEALDLVPDFLKDFASNNLLDALLGGKIRMESLSQVAFQPCVS